MNPDAVKILVILFDGKSLVSHLAQSFGAKQYSADLHDALVQAKKWHCKGDVTKDKTMKLLNQIVGSRSDNGKHQWMDHGASSCNALGTLRKSILK